MEPTPVLHEDDPGASFTRPDGTVVRNLSEADYAASYATGTKHVEGPGAAPDTSLPGVSQ